MGGAPAAATAAGVPYPRVGMCGIMCGGGANPGSIWGNPPIMVGGYPYIMCPGYGARIIIGAVAATAGGPVATGDIPAAGTPGVACEEYSMALCMYIPGCAAIIGCIGAAAIGFGGATSTPPLGPRGAA